MPIPDAPRPTTTRAGRDWTRRTFVHCALAALGAPALVGCQDSSGPNPEPTPGSPRLAARPGTPSAAPTLGLSALGLGGSRDGLLYVPQDYSPDTPAPLFVALHGAGGEASNWDLYHDRAETRDMVLLIPESRSTTWDLISEANWGADVEFLNTALAYTFERCAIDPGRIALGGFSDGATYALSLGVANGDLFTHLAGYSPGFLVVSDDLVGKPRIFISHGRDDPVIPVATSRDNIVPYLQDAGYDVIYEEFDGGHEVPGRISDMALDWVVQVA